MTDTAFFDDPTVLASGDTGFPLGTKGRSLVRLRLEHNLPTPPGFIFSCDETDIAVSGRPGTSVSQRAELTPGGHTSLSQALAELGQRAGADFGDDTNPLFVSVRSGTSDATVGAPEAVLNVGLNDELVEVLAAKTGNRRFAYDSYRRLVQAFGHIVCQIPLTEFERVSEAACSEAGTASLADLDAAKLGMLVGQFKQVISSAGAEFDTDPTNQFSRIIAGIALRSAQARERLPHSVSSAKAPEASPVIVQAMVFGNRDTDSGTGLATSRDTLDGSMEPAGWYLPGGQGHDVGDAGANSLDYLATSLPEVHAQVLGVLATLEAAYGDVVQIEFTVDSGSLYILQAGVAPRSGVAAVRLAVGLTSDDSLNLLPEQALLLVTSDHIDQILHNQFDAGVTVAIAKGLGASPGAAVGQVYFSADAAVDAYDEGQDVILVATETSPEDVHGMAIAEGILTAKGGLASHAAVVARGWGKPAVCGAEGMQVSDVSFEVDGVVVSEGDLISIDGATGLVFLGEITMSESEIPPELETVLTWADSVRANKMGVRANADSPDDAAKALEFGAEGIGLCRTEHQFLGARLPLIQRFILATSADEEDEALARLADVQRSDFEALLSSMDGLPVTIRLLDPPLHEFLPALDELIIRQATEGLSPADEDVLSAALQWHEENPMLGVRGVRLGVLRSGLYQMQVRALLDAVASCQAKGLSPQVEIMVPLIVNDRELALVREWISVEIEAAHLESGPDGFPAVLVGTMIETPRAALTASDIATHADFFSFGTNDLTQMTLGFSRDDIEAKMMGTYLERGLLDANPFQTIDHGGVGQLVQRAAQSARITNPEIKLGVCGEHGGDAASIALFWAAGLDYVSCSPYRVPIARLSAAQAIITNPGRDWVA